MLETALIVPTHQKSESRLLHSKTDGSYVFVLSQEKGFYGAGVAYPEGPGTQIIGL